MGAGPVLLSEWREKTTGANAKQHNRVVAVTLPFITIPGVIDQILPFSQISYMSLIPRRSVISPALSPTHDVSHEIPLLSQHLGLVTAYWGTRERWKPWKFLEDDFAVLRGHGFCFAEGSMGAYTEVVKCAASQFADAVEEVARRSRATAILVYGRGHWTMNAAAFVSLSLGLPLYVVERGILPNSYIVDESLPFTAPGSKFRSSWEQFLMVEDWDREDFIGLTESRWRLYTSLHKKDCSRVDVHQRPSGAVVGQCLFDYNCIGAPFTNAVEFVEYTLRERPEALEHDTLVYRPHPLSPEEYPTEGINTRHGSIRVDLSEPWEILRNGPTLYTWNSTLGLEGRLVFDLAVNTLDPQCHYAWIHTLNSLQHKRRYIVFLNEISSL
jgi:hypothetical protein